MGHFSVEITDLPGSLLSGNQHHRERVRFIARIYDWRQCANLGHSNHLSPLLRVAIRGGEASVRWKDRVIVRSKTIVLRHG